MTKSRQGEINKERGKNKNDVHRSRREKAKNTSQDPSTKGSESLPRSLPRCPIW